MTTAEKRYETRLEQDGVALIATAPENVMAILLADGWHDVSDCKYVHFAVAPAASPPKPNTLYASLSIRDATTGRKAIVPFSQIIAFQVEEEEAPFSSSRQAMVGAAR